MARTHMAGPAPHRVSFPLRWQFAAAALLLIATAITLYFITQPGRGYVPEFTGGARARLSQTAFDYGNVKNNTSVETVFTVKNVGDKQLVFPREPQVKVVEGCCPPLAEIKRSVLNPGESTQVRLQFSMHEGMDGPHDFRVRVLTNDLLEPEQEVVVLSNWVP